MGKLATIAERKWKVLILKFLFGCWAARK